MAETARLSTAPPERTSLDQAALREGGMELIRQLAEETWTDHNVHDPGITLLEAFSYAMTELGFRIQLDIADLLRSGEARAPAGLVPAHRVLPSGPVTADDLGRLLLDHHLVEDAWITPVAGGRFRGLFEVALAFEDRNLNSNTYALEVQFNGDDYALDAALPYWDQDEAAPFRQGAAASVVQMVDPGTGVWRPLTEPRTFFGTMRVDHTGPAGVVELGVVLRIATELAQPALVIPGILAAAAAEIADPGPTPVQDNLAARFAARVSRAASAVSQVRRYVSSWRSLCEEPERLVAARVQEIAVGARIEVTGAADLDRLLAEILFAIDHWLSPPVRFHSLSGLLAAGRRVEEIFDGPLLRHGFLDRDELARRARRSQLYVSDVLRLIMGLRRAEGGDVVAQENPSGRDIVAVTDLRLSNYVNNRPVTIDARDCLRLAETDRYRPRLSPAKSRIIFVRDDVEVAYDAARVGLLFQDLQDEARASTLPDDASPELAVAGGEALPVTDYFPFQNDLPRVYGVGEAGLPDSAGVERQARALQTKGYLMPFEQILADVTAQLGSINRFFSPDAEESATYFPRPLFDLPGVRYLLRAFAPGGDWQADWQAEWQAFVALPDNPHRLALQAAAETPNRFLDRRNRMLDHLLARQGEEMVAWGQELHRQARRELLDKSFLTEEDRPRAVNARLVRAKAAFLADAPELSAARLQAFGHPLRRRPGLLAVEESADRFRWSLDPDSDAELVAVDPPLATAAGAAIAAEEAAILAAQPAFYQHFPDSGQRRLRLRDGAGSAARPLAESRQTFPTATAADDAIQAAGTRFARRRRQDSQTPLERRICHLTGIRSQTRRRLLVPVDDFFEIFAGVGGTRWRLWQLPGNTGQQLLTSATAFAGAAEARVSIARVLRYGIDEWNYRPTEPAAGTFAFELLDPAGAQLGVAPAALPSRRAAEQATAATVDHLYRRYSAEGLHLVEHLLLRPRAAADPPLQLPAGDGVMESDPYSHRLSIVLPSGYQRDFAADPVVRAPALPHRFQDPELRRHAKRMVRQSCPAHLLPSIYWVDREAPGSGPTEASFDSFEQRFFAWLDTLLIPGAAPATATAARDDLTASINAIALEAGS